MGQALFPGRLGPGAVPSVPEGSDWLFSSCSSFSSTRACTDGAVGSPGGRPSAGLGDSPWSLSPSALCPAPQLPPSPQILNPALQLRVLRLGPPSQHHSPRARKPEQVWGSPHWLSASLATFFPLLVSGVLQTVSLYIVFALIIGGGRGDPVSVAPSYMEVESVCLF